MYALVFSIVNPYPCGNYAAASAYADELVALADEKGALYLEGARNDDPRLHFGLDRQSLGRGSNDHLWNSPHGRSTGATLLDAVVLIIFGESLCGTRPIR